MPFLINLTTDAEEDLAYFKARERRFILDGIKTHLRFETDQESKRRKKLDPNPLASWELRIDNYRAFYDVEEAASFGLPPLGGKSTTTCSFVAKRFFCGLW